jgi:uncharacterized protein YjbI with pentapeptide repeats
MANKDHIALLENGVTAWNAWRAEHPDTRPDLSEANLRGAGLSEALLNMTNLSGTNLSEALLNRANLSGANLSGALLNRADLSEANLTGAFLINVDLTNTCLHKADLHEADLRGANLHLAQLTEADLYSAILHETILADVNLFDARGLEECRYSGPSPIDSRTLQYGPLPGAFLRGCGLSDWEIEATKLHQEGLTPSQVTDIAYELIRIRGESPIQFYSCFISYSHADATFAQRLHDALQEWGIRCWLDIHQMLPGDDIYEQVDRGIRLWDKVLLCCSQSSLTSWWVDKEINTAFIKEQQLMKERGHKVLALIPLNLDGYLFSNAWQGGKVSDVRSRIAADFTGWEQNGTAFAVQLDRLVKALRADNGGREVPPVSKL